MGNQGRCTSCIEDDIGKKVTKTIFQKIIDRELPAEILYEDDLIICIKDKYPAMPIHLLFISKKCIPTLNDVKPVDFPIIQRIIEKAQDFARALDILDNYKLVTNVGAKAGQSIFHLHFHLLSAKSEQTNPSREG